MMRKLKMTSTIKLETFETFLEKQLIKNPEFAKEYLNQTLADSLEDGDFSLFTEALIYLNKKEINSSQDEFIFNNNDLQLLKEMQLLLKNNGLILTIENDQHLVKGGKKP
jgi:hypothetical protein